MDDGEITEENGYEAYPSMSFYNVSSFFPSFCLPLQEENTYMAEVAGWLLLLCEVISLSVFHLSLLVKA
jgi:hypothetical protein